MRKTNLFLIGAFLGLLLISPFSADATECPGSRLVDEAGLLTDEENRNLRNTLDEISERIQFDVIIVTTNSLEGYSATEYADDFYDRYGYGMGEGDDGILLLIALDERDWAITTYGFGITAFTDGGLDYMISKFKGKLSGGDFEGAFSNFAELCEELVIQAKTGSPYDSGTQSGKSTQPLPGKSPSPYWPVYSILIGVVIATIIMSIMRGQLKSVRMQTAAGDYVKGNSLDIAVSRDLFLYSTVSKVKIEKAKTSPGGSSTHVSSSGRRHGGSSGKF